MRKRLPVYLALLLISFPLAFALAGWTDDLSREVTRFVFSSLSGKGFQKQVPDAQGIPWTDFGKVDGEEIGRIRNPCHVAHQGSVYYFRYLAMGEEEDRERLFACANWLMAHTKSRGDSLYFSHGFPMKKYGLKAGFRSALTQARAMEVMLFSYRLSQDDGYLETARGLRHFLNIPVERGGVSLQDRADSWWFEEYAGMEGNDPRVLNGMLTVLRVLDLMYEDTGDEEAKLLFDKGLTNLKENIYAYDNDGYSHYDRLGHAPGKAYHVAHVWLLRLLNAEVDEPVLRSYEEKWGSYGSPGLWLRLSTSPNRADLAIWLLNVLACFLLLLVLHSWLGRRVRVIASFRLQWRSGGVYSPAIPGRES